jgi:hypothetical protein
VVQIGSLVLCWHCEVMMDDGKDGGWMLCVFVSFKPSGDDSRNRKDLYSALISLSLSVSTRLSAKANGTN